jgi:predicted DNA-binding transcriptional regulator AlpA
MTIWRWLKDEEMGFPQPTYFAERRYWKLSELEAWERKRAAESMSRRNDTENEMTAD